MKLLYLSNARLPTEKAHGIHVMKMCESFAGVANVELVIPHRFNQIKENPFDYYGVARVFKIKKLPCLDLIPLDKYIGYFGLWIESISFSFFSFWYLLFKKADIIYTREKFLLFPLVLFKKNLIFEAHTFPKNYFLYSLFFKKVKSMVVITQQLKDLFVKQGISSNKILKAVDGVDLEKFNIKETQEECKKKLALPLNKKIILYTGHFYKWKGATVLLEAAREIQDILFVFVGGTKRDIVSLRQKAQALNNVMIAGHKPYAEIPYWLKAADVLVLPNSGQEEISKYWTSPIKMFEYMAAKRPIVASNLPSIQEILNEENAILVEPDSPEVLARGIKEVLGNPQLSDKISNKAYMDVQNYSWKKRVQEILEFSSPR